MAIRFPGREALARAVRRVHNHDFEFTGASDDGFSESVYLDDPDGNGIELTWDRPRSEWPTTDAGRPQHTRPESIDVGQFLAAED